MPGEDGYRLVCELRAREGKQKPQHVAAVKVSAYATISDQAKTKAAGFDAHVAKPFDPSEIVRLVATFKRAAGL